MLFINSIEDQKLQVKNQYRMEYGYGGNKDFIHKIFKGRKRYKDKGDGMLEGIKDWANISNDVTGKRDVAVGDEGVAEVRKKGSSLMRNINTFKNEYFSRKNRIQKRVKEEEVDEKDNEDKFNNKRIFRASTLNYEKNRKAYID